MAQEYLLDTNAYFNLLKEAQSTKEAVSPFSEQVDTIKAGKVCISKITTVEIISVLGKYARGVSGDTASVIALFQKMDKFARIKGIPNLGSAGGVGKLKHGCS